MRDDLSECAEILAIAGVVNLFELNGVELAMSGADATAYTHETVDNSGAASEASAAFFLYLFFGECAAEIIERGLRFFTTRACRFLARCVIESDRIYLSCRCVERFVVSVVAAEFLSLAFVNEAMDRDGGLFSGRNSVDGKLRPGHQIAAGKHIIDGSLAGNTVRSYSSVRVYGQQTRRVDAAEFYLLTGRADNACHRHLEKLSGAYRFAAAASRV